MPEHDVRNLTNRGLIRVEPDRVLVWSDIQRKEATELHSVSSERVVVTGVVDERRHPHGRRP
jgi:hypothetical protein